MTYNTSICEYSQTPPTQNISVQYHKQHNCHLAPCYLNSDKLFLTLSNWYRNPEQGFEPGTYSNLKHGNLYHSATTAGDTLP